MTTSTGDVLDRVAQINPVPDERLGAGQRARADGVLARIVRLPIDEGAAAPAASAAPAAGQSRRHAAARRWARGAVVAVVGVLGVGGVAYATGVTPTSVIAGIQALQKADAGTVAYSNAPVEDGAAVLARIAANARAAGDFGDPAKIVATHSLETADGWYDDDDQPGVASTERWFWFLGPEWVRMQSALLAEKGMNADMPDPSWGPIEYRPPVVFPSTRDDRLVPNGKDLTLGPTPADTIRTLAPNEPAGSDRLDYLAVDHYADDWASGIGLLAGNRAAFVDALATMEFTYYGPATDQVGRTGEAFGVTWTDQGLATEKRILLDPSDGSVLAVEDVLHGPWILGSRDHVGSSTTYVSVETIDSLPACEDTPGCTIQVEG